MPESTPLYPRDDCPSWCRARDGDDIHRESGWHEGHGVSIAVISRSRTAEAASTIVPVSGAAEEVAIVPHRDFGSPDTWIAIASECHGLDVTIESAERLLHALGGVLCSMRESQAN